MTFWEMVLADSIGFLPAGILIYVMAYWDGKRSGDQ